MLNASRALDLNAESAPKLPTVPALGPLYRKGTIPRKGELIMIAGRSGHQKSGFALWWVCEMNLPTLYFSADMNGFQASVRLACKMTGCTTDEVEAALREPRQRREILDLLAGVNITFSFGSPIKWRSIDHELDAYVELWGAFPDVIVVDNLMDIEGCEDDYKAQMTAMQSLSDLSRDTGSTVIVLHHATDKSAEARYDPDLPPSRADVKNGLAEKPELALTVALSPHTSEFRIATVKQRMGPSDQSGRKFATLHADPARTTFASPHPGDGPLTHSKEEWHGGSAGAE